MKLSGTGCTEGSATTHTWQEALQLAETTNTSGGFAGYTDWRLPNIKELESIVERKCYSPSINLIFFPNQSSSGVWSGSAYASSSSDAWYVNFSNGNGNYNARSYSFSVRLVRGGQ